MPHCIDCKNEFARLDRGLCPECQAADDAEVASIHLGGSKLPNVQAEIERLTDRVRESITRAAVAVDEGQTRLAMQFMKSGINASGDMAKLAHELAHEVQNK